MYDRSLPLDKAAILHRMGEQIAHRGPDDHQLFCSAETGIVFRRLSIVDPDGGRQPLTNEDGSVTLVVNGEIYNFKDLARSLKGDHHFKSRSDCEVLLHLYEERGVDFLGCINGMFALALYDSRKKIFLLARDRMGIKPLYYSLSRSRLVFGSEIKALFPFPDCPCEFNWQEALDGTRKTYAAANYEVETCFRGIRQLRGGEYLITEDGADAPLIKNYWSLQDLSCEASAADGRTAAQLVAEYRELLADAVRLMLLGDVEIGLFLSGGIDSTAIAALAARQTSIRTFSVLNPDTIECSDARYSWNAADCIGLPNHQVCIAYDAGRHDAAYWKNLVWQCETYECGAEQLYKYELYRYVKQCFPDLKVVLIGQGSDEFNGGYAHKYVGEGNPELRNRWSEFEQIISGMEHTGLLSGNNHALNGFRRYIDRDYLADLQGSSRPPHPWYGYLQMHAKNLQVYQLLHEDRTAMANGIENRVPFLDHRIVEFILRVPQAHFPELFWNKQILRRAMAGLLPADLCNRPKVPFIFDNKVNSSGRMLTGILGANDEELLHYALEDNQAKHILDAAQVGKLWDRVRNDPHYREMDELRYLVNMGILSRMAGEITFDHAAVVKKITLPVPAYSNTEPAGRNGFRDYMKEEDSGAAKNGAPTGLLLADEVRILNEMNGSWYLFRSDELAEIIRETDEANRDWIRVLLHALHNQGVIDQSLADLSLSHQDLTKAIKKSFKAGIVCRPARRRKIQVSKLSDHEQQ